MKQRVPISSLNNVNGTSAGQGTTNKPTNIAMLGRTHQNTMEAPDGEQSRQAAAQIGELLAAAWNGPAYDALAGVCVCSGRARRCSGAANVASEMTSFTSRWRMRAHPAGGIAKDASARAMIAGLVFPIVYPLLAALQACADINVSTTLRYDNGNRQRIS